MIAGGHRFMKGINIQIYCVLLILFLFLTSTLKMLHWSPLVHNVLASLRHSQLAVGDVEQTDYSQFFFRIISLFLLFFFFFPSIGFSLNFNFPLSFHATHSFLSIPFALSGHLLLPFFFHSFEMGRR